MIELQHIQKSFNQLRILQDIQLTIQPKQVTTIVGSSGAGKSTMLHIMGTLLKPDSGKLLINGQDMNQLKESDLAAFRNKHLGFIFQFHHLLPEFTALENVIIPAMIAGDNSGSTTKRAKELLDYLKLSHRATHKPGELSGGEQQRVAVARALMNQPAYILADEPSGNLDTKNAEDLHQLFFQLKQDMHQTFVIVTHNEKLAQMSDRIITMSDGKIVKDVTQ